MAISVLVDAVTGAPEWTGRMTRGMFSSLFAGKTAARPTGARSAVAYATPTDTITVSGTTITIKPHAGVLDLEAAAAAGPYPYWNSADAELEHDAAHATLARVDIVCIRLDDPAEADGTSVPLAEFTYTAGTAAGSPTPPATPARSMVLAHVNVPASGGGASTITWKAPYGAGGIIPVRNDTERDALAVDYPGTTDAPLVIWHKADAAFYFNDGTGWQALADLAPLEAATGVKNYRWADAAARTAQTGMAAADLGFQVDTGITYRYSGAAWVAWESDWITWDTAPTNFTVGTGGSAYSLQQYRYVNGAIRVKFRFVLGTSGASVGAAPYLTLPFNFTPLTTRYAALVGAGSIYDDDTTSAYYIIMRQNLTAANQIVFNTDTGAAWGGITATAPITWAAGDIMAGEFWVDPA